MTSHVLLKLRLELDWVVTEIALTQIIDIRQAVQIEATNSSLAEKVLSNVPERWSPLSAVRRHIAVTKSTKWPHQVTEACTFPQPEYLRRLSHCLKPLMQYKSSYFVYCSAVFLRNLIPRCVYICRKLCIWTCDNTENLSIRIQSVAARTPTIQTEDVHGFRQSLQVNSKTVSRFTPYPLPSNSSFIILPFDVITSHWQRCNFFILFN
jgi:hypothetical protein